VHGGEVVARLIADDHVVAGWQIHREVRVRAWLETRDLGDHVDPVFIDRAILS